MKWKPPALDRGAEQWSDREIEFEQMRANWAKVETENSPLRRYAPIILSAAISVVVTVATVYVDQSSAARDRATQARRWDNERAANALRLYFENPDLFVGEFGAQNLDLLKQTTPEETMNGIVQAVNDRADTTRIKASQEAASVVAQVTPGVVAAPPPTTTSTTLAAPAPVRSADLLRRADERRYETIERSPSRNMTRVNSAPSDFTIYMQYGSGSQQRATQLQSSLSTTGYKVPNIDEELTAPAVPQVRYYIATQASAARQLAQQVGTAIGREPLVRFVGEGKALPDGIIEVWLPGGMDAADAAAAAVDSQLRDTKRVLDSLSRSRSIPARPPAPAAPPPGQ